MKLCPKKSLSYTGEKIALTKTKNNSKHQTESTKHERNK